MDIFEARSAKAMLISNDSEPFDDPDFIFELKLDGDRCLAYLDRESTILMNKSQRELLAFVPELAGIHRQTKERCILDGELIIGSGTKDDFGNIRKRMMFTNKSKVERAAMSQPATFVAYDILYLRDKDVLQSPLTLRKEILENIIQQNDRLVISRTISEKGIAFFSLVREQGLEGIIAKRSSSQYLMGKRSKDWIKIKNWIDDDFVICGYLPKKNNIISIIVGQFNRITSRLVYKGHVSLSPTRSDYAIISTLPPIPSPPFEHPLPPGNEGAIWLPPSLVCTVEFMCSTPGGGLRQPVFKSLRQDKEPGDCLEPDPALHSCVTT